MPGGVGVGQIVAATAERRKPARAPGVIAGPAGWRWLLLADWLRIGRRRIGRQHFGQCCRGREMHLEMLAVRVVDQPNGEGRGMRLPLTFF